MCQETENPGDVGSSVREGFLQETGIETKALIVSKLKAQTQEEKIKETIQKQVPKIERHWFSLKEFSEDSRL